MKRKLLALLPLILLPLTPALAQPPHVANGPEPRDGREVLRLTEVWHRGHEEDDLIFGSISTVQTGPDGNIYVLDQQLSQVCVFDPQGELLRTLSREGEGPGESRQPEHMVFLADGTLGLVQYINGRIIKIALDGTPVDVLMPPGFDPNGGGLSSIRRVRCRGGSLVINGARVEPTDDGMIRTQFLLRCNDRGEPLVEYLSRRTPSNLLRDGWIEQANDFPSHERWDIDLQGRVVAATERNDYLLRVYEPDGTVAFTFGREQKPYRRTEAEKQEIRDSVVVINAGQRMQVDVTVEDHAPAVGSLQVMDDGEIWVLTAPGQHDQPDGIMQTYDVFDAGGVFVRRAAVACPADADEDRLIFLGGNRVALVRGAVQARRNTFGGSRGEEEEAAVHDLKIYSY